MEFIGLLNALDNIGIKSYAVGQARYLFLCNMKTNVSRWSRRAMADFDMPGEYMYDAGAIWEKRIHPDDLAMYQESMKRIFELEKRVKLSAYPDQARLFGYLSERLINVYCIRHRLKIKYVPVIMPLEETFQNPSNLLYTLRRLKNDLIYKLTEL